MATINSVLIGDEKSQRDITKSFVSNQVKDEKVNVVANSSLIPMFETTPVTTLDDTEEAEVQRAAVKDCNGAQDNKCVESTADKLRQAKLREKLNQAQSSANLVKGRRMTVNYTDEYGRERTVVVPEGQKFELDQVSNGPPKTIAQSIPKTSDLVLQIFSFLGTMTGAALYAFSVVATYKTLTIDSSPIVGAVGTAVAVIFPFSGFLIMFGYFALREFAKYETLDDIVNVISSWVVWAIQTAVWITWKIIQFIYNLIMGIYSMFFGRR
jgi:hypothetical protein